MSLMTIRLELGRTADMPAGDSRHGYEFVAPINRDGHLDAAFPAALLYVEDTGIGRCSARHVVRAEEQGHPIGGGFG